LIYIKNIKNAKNVFFYISGGKYGAYWFLSVPAIVCGLSSVDYSGNRCDHAGSPTGSFSTTTMVKESFTTGNSEVSRRDMPSYLMRWLLVDKLQGEVTPCGSVRACQKIVGFGAGLGE
jgi:hypothetical protein